MADAANRAILLTPAGTGAIAVVRILGIEVESWLARRFSRSAMPGRCAHGELRDDRGQVLDDIVVVLLPDRQTADLNLHGGPWVVESVRQLLQRDGFTLLDELPLESLDGKDVIEREMLASLPHARTELAIRILLSQPHAWRAFEVSELTRDDVAAVIADQCLWRMLHPARVAIVGIPNVGKSTLANQLFGQERSITADLPGTTRDWVGELADVDGVPVVLLDTPGVRESNDAIEQSAIALSRNVISSADLVIVVIDPTQPVEAQRALAESFANRVTVLNKSDLAQSSLATDVSTIATTGEGVAALRALIRARLGCSDLTLNRPRWWTQRQRDALADKLARFPASDVSR